MRIVMNPEPHFDFTATLQISDNKLWGAHFEVPVLVVNSLCSDANDRRVVCTLNQGAAQYQCAVLPFGNGRFVITVNKKLRDRLKLQEGSQFQVHLVKDDSAYGLPMPEELEELLRQDEQGNRFFHALTPGKQRTLLYIIGQPKTSDTRLKRALVVVEHLKTNAGNIDYKQLNRDLKEA